MVPASIVGQHVHHEELKHSIYGSKGGRSRVGLSVITCVWFVLCLMPRNSSSTRDVSSSLSSFTMLSVVPTIPFTGYTSKASVRGGKGAREAEVGKGSLQ